MGWSAVDFVDESSLDPVVGVLRYEELAVATRAADRRGLLGAWVGDFQKHVEFHPLLVVAAKFCQTEFQSDIQSAKMLALWSTLLKIVPKNIYYWGQKL